MVFPICELIIKTNLTKKLQRKNNIQLFSIFTTMHKSETDMPARFWEDPMYVHKKSDIKSGYAIKKQDTVPNIKTLTRK